VLAIIIPVLLGFGLIYLFAAGVIGIATALAGAFALVAFAVTAVVFHEDRDDPDTGWNSRLRM
jgi:hypothetical protein